jgi:predicted flavoprotein YhiN
MAKYVKISTPANNEVHVNSSTKNKIVTSQNQVVVTSVGTQGPAGVAQSSEVFTQAIASNEWTINHSLNKKPSVTVVDSADTVVVGEVSYETNSRIVIKFEATFSGKAYLN